MLRSEKDQLHLEEMEYNPPQIIIWIVLTVLLGRSCYSAHVPGHAEKLVRAATGITVVLRTMCVSNGMGHWHIIYSVLWNILMRFTGNLNSPWVTCDARPT